MQVSIDPKQFLGLDSVADAVEYLHSGKSFGKVWKSGSTFYYVFNYHKIA